MIYLKFLVSHPVPTKEPTSPRVELIDAIERLLGLIDAIKRSSITA